MEESVPESKLTVLDPNSQQDADSRIEVNRRGVSAETVIGNPADKDWTQCISEFFREPREFRNGKPTLYDPKIGRYYYRLSDGTKVITG
jgi:hypothetical protein